MRMRSGPQMTHAYARNAYSWVFKHDRTPLPLRRDATHGQLFNLRNPSVYTQVIGENLPRSRLREIGQQSSS